ncbi:hypothetical protein BJP27_24475 (plasmid) [Pseudomonas oryzihabitans]|nr:hypothetical protein BJP27_23825 [Pseudomonas psychrotolerans]APQ14728.1 hypothetical protein BJP27_24475 [Pseudomonas psychrotolerans]
MKEQAPAFPGVGLPGMSLRAYLVAHAPAEPQAWFEPVFPEVVEPTPFPANSWPAKLIDHAVANNWDQEQIDYQVGMQLVEEERVEELKARIAQSIAARRQRQADIENTERERYLQWPLAWADAMLEKLAK